MAALRCAGISASASAEALSVPSCLVATAFHPWSCDLVLGRIQTDTVTVVAVENWPGEPEAVLNGNAKHATNLPVRTEVAMPANHNNRAPSVGNEAGLPLAYTSSKRPGRSHPWNQHRRTASASVTVLLMLTRSPTIYLVEIFDEVHSRLHSGDADKLCVPARDDGAVAQGACDAHLQPVTVLAAALDRRLHGNRRCVRAREIRVTARQGGSPLRRHRRTP